MSGNWELEKKRIPVLDLSVFDIMFLVCLVCMHLPSYLIFIIQNASKVLYLHL